MKVIVTGSTGMIGKGIVLTCLEDPTVTEVLVINRRPLDVKHNKIKELIHADFSEFESVANELTGYDACFHCMGVSVAGKSEEKYRALTYDVSISLAQTVKKQNPGIVFNYVSGQGTDSSEKGRTMWARVKGKTENDILKMGFEKAFMFRPGLIIPENGVRSSTPLYNAIYVVLRPFFPWLRNLSAATTTTRIGKAMIASVKHDNSKTIWDPQTINEMAKR